MTGRCWRTSPVEPSEEPVKNTESVTRFVDFDVDVKFWASDPPDVSTARPARCPACHRSAERPGGRTRLHGHGLRGRQVRGPLEAGGAVVVLELSLRRYACQACGAIITVGPRGLLPRRRYSLMAIAVALWLWAVRRLTDPEVRRATCPVAETGLSRPERWTTLRRWARAVREGRLWPKVSLGPSWSLRACAERAARQVWSRGGIESSTDEARVFRGAALAH